MRLFFSDFSLAIFCAAASFVVSNAQTGTITGRIVYEDGGGASNINVTLTPIKANRQPASARGFGDRAVTDEEGKFQFNGLAPGVYMINAFDSKGYVREPSSAAEMREQRYCRVGDNVTITMIRGGVITGRACRRAITGQNSVALGFVRYPLSFRTRSAACCLARRCSRGFRRPIRCRVFQRS